VLCNIIDFGMNIQEAGDAPRVRHMGSSQPTGTKMEQGGIVALEFGISPGVQRKLSELGHRLQLPFKTFFGGYQAIVLDPETGMYLGASDPRRAGCAFGY
jgi:gamma-glutamyltranspeptidase/glutathione hydrolase